MIKFLVNLCVKILDTLNKTFMTYLDEKDLKINIDKDR